MWFIVWILFAAIILGAFGWSQLILHEQKKAWEAYAKKTGLNFVRGKFTESPSISGMIAGRKLSVYTATQQTKDARGQRFVTAIEIETGAGLPAAAAIASQQYADFLSGVRLSDIWSPPEGSAWPVGTIVKTKNRDALAKYMTPERIKIVNGLLSMKNSIALFFFDEVETVLRMETSDPLRDKDHMEKIIKRLMRDVDSLVVTEDEKKAMKKTGGGDNQDAGSAA